MHDPKFWEWLKDKEEKPSLPKYLYLEKEELLIQDNTSTEVSEDTYCEIELWHEQPTR